ncbi:Uncharacterised protein [Mycobacterium tuberculosis]|nr:Uncharacterised protein [Mycobacterium tuberculosis]
MASPPRNRSNWRALSKMHLFTVVAESESVDVGALEQFTRAASALAKNRKGVLYLPDPH